MHFLKIFGCFVIVFGGFFALAQLGARLLGVHKHPPVSRLHLLKAQQEEFHKEE